MTHPPGSPPDGGGGSGGGTTGPGRVLARIATYTAYAIVVTTVEIIRRLPRWAR